jgi:hypothetical protein
MENNKEIIHESEVKELIIELRGEKVLIDRDVAKLYGVETRDINKAVKNNADKFPENYCFSLQLSEKQELVENFHRLESLKYSTVVPRLLFSNNTTLSPAFPAASAAVYPAGPPPMIAI